MTEQLPLKGMPKKATSRPKSKVDPILKSAVQKAVRRGSEGGVVWAVRRLWGTPDGRRWLIWRIPIIAAEEVWPVLGVVGALVKQMGRGLPGDEQMDHVIGIIQGMGRLAKNKDADGLLGVLSDAGKTPLGNGEPEIPDQEVYEFARQVVEKERSEIWRFLHHQTTSQAVRELITAAAWRYPQGGMPGDRVLLVTASALAVKSSAVVEAQVGVYDGTPNLCGEELPPWIVADMHTAPGKQALYAVAAEMGIKPRALSDLWFMMESGAVDRTAPGSVWWKALVEFRMRAFGFGGIEGAKQRWAELEPLVRAKVEEFVDWPT